MEKIKQAFNSLRDAMLDWIEGIESGIADALAAQAKIDEEQNKQIAEIFGIINGEPIDPPIDPPINPELGEVEIVANAQLIPGTRVQFEAIVSTSLDIETVEFFLNGVLVNVERNFKYESNILIPEKDFEVSVRVSFKNGQSQILQGGKVFAPVELPTGGGGGGGGVTAPERTPITPNAYSVFAAEKTGNWFSWNAQDLATGDYDKDALKTLYNSSDEKIGNPSIRAHVESVPELGGVKAMNVFGNEDSDNFTNRLSVPDNFEYPGAAAIGVKFGMVRFPHNETGVAATDRRTYKPFHWKGFGAQPVGGPPPSGNTVGNPVQEAAKCEFVLVSDYDFNAVSGTGKGDQMAVELGTATSFPLEVSSDSGNYYYQAVGLYAHDVTDYKYQSQIFPLTPDAQGAMTNVRLAFNFSEKYDHEFIIEPNTFVDGVDQEDGQFIWVITNANLNGGQPFVAAKLTGRSFTTGGPVVFARGGIGWYINAEANKPAGMHYGIFITNHETVYKS